MNSQHGRNLCASCTRTKTLHQRPLMRNSSQMRAAPALVVPPKTSKNCPATLTDARSNWLCRLATATHCMSMSHTFIAAMPQQNHTSAHPLAYMRSTLSKLESKIQLGSAASTVIQQHNALMGARHEHHFTSASHFSLPSSPISHFRSTCISAWNPKQPGRK